MKILVCHNFYQQPGGEDQVFAEEAELLERNGHEVARFTLHNDAIKSRGGVRGQLALTGETLWNRRAYARLYNLVRTEKPAVVHFHNTFPLISPAAYYAARRGGAAVVQTLHNYRLMCPNGLFFRDGRVCEDCLGRAPWPAVVHKCYHDSAAASAVAAGMLAFHRARGTYRSAVDLYVALTEFARRKHVQGGLPEAKIVVKPNFVGTDRGVGSGAGGFALFVGRLEQSKGLGVLLDAWSRLSEPDARLKILGGGPMAPRVRAAASGDSRIEWLGRRPPDEVYRRMGEAAFLVVSSTWYEGLPRTIVEAFSKGTPVVASRIGALEELVRPRETGLHFEPGDAGDLASQVRWALAHPAETARMRANARREYESKYTAGENYKQLRTVYDRAIENRRFSDEMPGADVTPNHSLLGEPCALTVEGKMPRQL